MGRLSLSVGWGNSPELRLFCLTIKSLYFSKQCRPDQTPYYAMVNLGRHCLPVPQYIIFTQRSRDRTSTDTNNRYLDFVPGQK